MGPGSQLQLVQSQPVCPSGVASAWASCPEGRGRAVLAQPARPQTSEGLEAPSWLSTRTSCSGPAPGRENHLQAQTLLSMGPGPEQQLTRRRRGEVATFQPGCGLGRWLHSRQGPGILGKGSEVGQARPVGLCWTQACAKCGLPGQQQNIRWGRESQTGVWLGPEVLAPRRSRQRVPRGTGQG